MFDMPSNQTNGNRMLKALIFLFHLKKKIKHNSENTKSHIKCPDYGLM